MALENCTSLVRCRCITRGTIKAEVQAEEAGGTGQHGRCSLASAGHAASAEQIEGEEEVETAVRMR